MNTDEVITEDLLIKNPRFPPRLKRQKAFRNLHDYNLEYNYTLNYPLEFNQDLDNNNISNEILELNFNDNLYRSSPITNNNKSDDNNNDNNDNYDNNNDDNNGDNN